MLLWSLGVRRFELGCFGLREINFETLIFGTQILGHHRAHNYFPLFILINFLYLNGKDFLRHL